MLIKSLEYENFRNFKKFGRIEFSTDGRVTFIYGKNGDGKTTLHQLLQWIFYGETHFNKTTTDKLYNLEYADNCKPGEIFKVFGRVEFEDNGKVYMLRRSRSYEKHLKEIVLTSENLELQVQTNNNWSVIDDKIEEIIEAILPSGFADYFFFDGESMIADLRVKGRESATNLRKTIYSIFDLDILDMAKSHIGNISSKSTVLGDLFLKKGDDVPGGEVNKVKNAIVAAQEKLVEYKKDNGDYSKKIEENQNDINSISEKIGSTKSKENYEKDRIFYKQQAEEFFENADLAKAEFGEKVMDVFPELMLEKAVSAAKTTLELKAHDNDLPDGLDKQLINYLLRSDIDTCICGNKLCQESKNHIKYFLNFLPPASYISLYNKFMVKASDFKREYDSERLDKVIKKVVNNLEGAGRSNKKIDEIDEKQKESPDIEHLVIQRRFLEEENRELSDKIANLSTETRKINALLKKNQKAYGELTANSQKAKQYQRRIEIMQHVKDVFEDRLQKGAQEYSQRLQDNIDILLKTMLTSKRNVSVSENFTVLVRDSYNDESKSEGQFAIVSFAYIGGILKMLKNDTNMVQKTFPLVLDGPFSKLDAEQRQNVIDTIPTFAPQVILFSKDPIHEMFAKDKVGSIWTIQSNEEKNVAEVKEGYLWN